MGRARTGRRGRVGAALAALVLVALGLLVPAGDRTDVPPVETSPPGPDPRPSAWAATQRLYPHWRADPDVYHDALDAARTLRRARKQSTFGAWRLVGPTNIGGRVVDLAFDPHTENVLYAAAATGGVFRTDDLGETWTPIFDEQAVLTVGDLALDPVRPGVLYVGTGEANGGHNNIPGGGLYKSVDGGATWTFMGLGETASIARILVDPSRPDRIWVAAAGSYFAETEHRGVYRSTDGGATWSRVLFTDPAVGAIDLVGHPDDPDVLMAALWERVRGPYESRLAGPGSGVYLSTDGGDTWDRLGAAHGLPEDGLTEHPPVGRIGLTRSRTAPDHLYAYYNDGQSYIGFYRSADGGATWTDADPDDEVSVGMSNFSWYFGQVRVHPERPDLVFALDVGLMRSDDGGATWSLDYEFDGEAHVDYHALAFHPTRPDTLFVGHDGGVSRSFDAGVTWKRAGDLPITQFYEIGLDPHRPGIILGGTQDNGTIRSPTGGLDDWKTIFGGDGFNVIVDPVDPFLIYAESQLGNLVKSTSGGLSWQPITRTIPKDRVNWSTPFVMDPNDHRVLYYGAAALWRTRNAGLSWEQVSEDLPRGFIASPRLGTISTIAVAPSNSNTIYVGTDDGNVWVSRDFAETWTPINDGLPDRWVTRIAVDPEREQTAYVTFSGLKWKDPQPHVFRTDDAGATWTDISAGLPDAPVNAVAVDPMNTEVLYIGADVGAFVSLDRGERWEALGEGMPAVPVYDLDLDADRRVLVAGTHGRSAYALDVSVLTVASDPGGAFPEGIRIEALYPNPFRAVVSMQVRVDRPQQARLAVYDVLGREVARLMDGEVERGVRMVRWYGADDAGRALPVGTYFIRLITEGGKKGLQTQRVALVR